MAKKILVIDDEPAYIKTIATRLKANNYDVVAAADGAHAVARTHKEKPDLVLLDLKLPAGDGFHVLDALQKSYNTMTIPIILISAHADELMQQKAFEMGVQDFIKKPFTGEELLVKVKKALGETDV